MEIQTQIKKYRTSQNLSQEELAEKIYVTRQTISNWENGKSYPDIHSLILLSTVFGISLDQLIKGDIELMREEIKESELQEYDHYSKIFATLFIFCILSFVPLLKFLGIYGVVISILLYVVTLFYSFKVSKFKKKFDIYTYKEIIAFEEGKRLDEIEKQVERAKRPYQKFLLALGSGIITFMICMLLGWMLNLF